MVARMLPKMRAPLDHLLAMASMLSLTGLSEDQSRYLRTIEASARALQTLIRGMLEQSETGGTHEGRVAFSPAALVAEVVEDIAGKAAEKGLRCRSYVDAEAPGAVAGDRASLREALLQLLRNAVQSTQSGEIRLDVRVDSSGPPGIALRFTVIDTSPGLDAASLGAIFDDGEMASCRRVVQRMGGDLRVHSGRGEGATFWFTAQFYEAVEKEAKAAPAAPDPMGLRILIAEDHPINQVVLAEQLSGLGHECMTVVNGAEALKAIRQFPWDAILLDCNMPIMNGYETVEAIRREEAGTDRHLWVVAVTASALDGEREACLRAGMDDFLPKPLRKRELAGVLARIPPSSAKAPQSKPALDQSALDSLAASKTASGENLLERMTKLFTDSGMQLIAQMDESLRQDDLAGAIRAAHKMAGGCSYFGAETLYELCTSFEREGKKEDCDALHGLAPRIREEYNRVETALRARSPLQ
jgi:CheY-like chemotaxis protein